MRTIFTFLVLLFLSSCAAPERPSLHIEKELFATQQWNLAVLDLDYTPIVGELKTATYTAVSADAHAGRSVASILANEFARLDNVTIIERGQIEKLMAEQKLQQSGAISESSAVELGEILGADAVIVGEISDYVSWSSIIANGSTVSFSMRMIDVKSGKVIATGSESRIENFTVAFKNAQNLARTMVDQVITSK
jgi:hypothetical protein